MVEGKEGWGRGGGEVNSLSELAITSSPRQSVPPSQFQSLAPRWFNQKFICLASCQTQLGNIHKSQTENGVNSAIFCSFQIFVWITLSILLTVLILVH